MSDEKPKLVTRPGPVQRFGFSFATYVADYSNEARPAFRVACHCRNCSWKGEARFTVGTKIPMWTRCPQCEAIELSCHGDFLGRDEMSRDDEAKQHSAVLAKYMEDEKRQREIRDAARRPPAKSKRKMGAW